MTVVGNACVASGPIVVFGCSALEGRHQLLVGQNVCMCGAVKLTGDRPWTMPVTFHPSHATVPCMTASA